LANHYYYLIASLPMLSYDMENPMSEDEFFDTYGQILAKKDYLILQKSKLIPVEEKSGNTILEKWNNWERSLRNELVRMRAGKKGIDGEKYVAGEGFEAGISEIAREAFQAPSPLDAESILNKARWDCLETLESGHYFDFAKIIIYFLKLQVVQRKLQISKEKGKTAFSEIYAAIHDKNSAQKNS